MKSVLLFILFPVGLLAQQKTEVLTKPVAATVYQQGALLENDGIVKLSKGKSQITLRGLPQGIDPNSIQLASNGSFTLESIQFENDYLVENNTELNKQIEQLNNRLAELKLQLELLQKEETLLTANQELSPQQKSLESLTKARAYFVNAFTEIGKKKLQNEKETTSLQEQIVKLKKQQAYENQNRKKLGKITFIADSESSQEVKIVATYFVYNCGWSPSFNVRVPSLDADVQLEYNANVYQNTGIDWENIDLTLSTASPRSNNQKPTLYPQYLYENQPRAYMRESRVMAAPMAKMEDTEMAEAEAMEVAKVDNRFSLDYKLPELTTLISGQKNVSLEIEEVKMKAKFQYYLVPKIDKNAFLVAKVSDLDVSNFLSGPMSVYFEGKYVGKSYLNAATASEDINISLGRDNRVLAERKENREFRSKSFLGGKQKVDYQYDVTIKNNRSKAIDLMIEDQVPVSQNEQIEVEYEANGAQFEANEGKLTWKISINPNESKGLKLSYSVKYPKGMIITNLN